jgi:hypothetical protein
MYVLHFQNLIVILSHSESVCIISKCGYEGLTLIGATADPPSPNSHICHVIITN